MQSKLGSFLEALANTVLGFGISFVANLLILPTVGCTLTYAQNFYIGVLFTLVSLIRGYVLRRFFNRIRRFYVK